VDRASLGILVAASFWPLIGTPSAAAAGLRLAPELRWADGVSVAAVLDANGEPVPLEDLTLEGEAARLIGGRRGARLIAGARSGVAVLRRGEAVLEVRLEPDERDLDADGYPDGAELVSIESQERFAEWFSVIAESQFFELSVAWQPEHRDCSGLLRFAFVEALKRHDAQWLARYRFLLGAVPPDVDRYAYPDLPLLGTRPFRLRPGAYRRGEAASPDVFGNFATATLLREHSSRPIGRELAHARRGDLLFFTRFDDSAQPNHSMIYLGRGPDGHVRLVYHTGPDGHSQGEVRRVRLDQLLSHPDPGWHPVASNPNFLGVYRWKILGLEP
jgi:uncharacterized protein